VNAEDIVGFPRLTLRFDLTAELQRARSAEMARVTAIAEELSLRFGAVIAVGFLYCEILGCHGMVAECADLIRRLELAPSAATPRIAAELFALARAETSHPARAR
jgi:hypothetical protein